jgi:hypothetical protein
VAKKYKAKGSNSRSNTKKARGDSGSSSIFNKLGETVTAAIIVSTDPILLDFIYITINN